MRLNVFLVVALALTLSACSSVRVAQLASSNTLPLVDSPEPPAQPSYLIHAGDDLDIKFPYTPELNESLKVRPDGYITMQMVDDVKAGGLTPPQLDEALTQRFQGRIKSPDLSVIVRSFSGFKAYVGGEVSVPQVVPLDGNVSALQAVFRAGGVRPAGHMQSAILIRKGPQGEPVPYHLDLSDASMAQGRRDVLVALQPSDVLYIPRSPIANANKFVQQYIVDLLLLRGINFGFNVNHERHGDER